MTTTITTAPRRPFTTWVPAAALVVLLIGILVGSGARLTWEVPTVTIQPVRTTAEPSAVSVQHAERLATARHDLTAILDVIRHTPSIRADMHDHVQLLAAVSARHVPLDALDHDRARLRAAISGGHVPREALEPPK